MSTRQRLAAQSSWKLSVPGEERKARGGRRGSGEHLGRFDFFGFLSALHADKTWDMAPPPPQPPPETTLPLLLLLPGFENRPHWVGAPAFLVPVGPLLFRQRKSAAKTSDGYQFRPVTA